MAARTTTRSDLAMTALSALLRAHRVLFDALDGELRVRVGLTIPQWEVLEAIEQSSNQRLRMVDITKRMCVSKSGITQLVDRLEEKGLVARESSSSDRRLTYATLTEAGAKASRQAWPAFNSAIERHFTRHLSDEDMRCLRAALSKVLDRSGALDAVPDAMLDQGQE